MRSKLVLTVAVAVVLLGLSFWLTWGLQALGSLMLLLQGCAVALVIWGLFARDGKPVGLLEFVVKGFAVTVLLTIVLWFVSAWIWGSWLFYSFLLDFIFWTVLRALPFSLLPVAISVIAYGVFRKELEAWLILLSSWCVAVFGVFAVFDVWLFVFVQPYLSGPSYSSGAGAILREMLLVFVAFVVACVFTGVYVGLRKSRQSPPS